MIYRREIETAVGTIRAVVNSRAMDDARFEAPRGDGFHARELERMAATIREQAAAVERMAAFLRDVAAAEATDELSALANA